MIDDTYINIASHNMESPSAGPENTSAAQTVASIDDLFRKILIRLPKKKLSRLRLVSKRFASFILTLDFNRAAGLVFPHFIDMIRGFYVLANVEPWYECTPFFVHDDEDEDRREEYYDDCPFDGKFIDDSSGVRVIQSCNGLFLCRSHVGRKFRRIYYVYNSTSKKYATLPVGVIDMKTVRGMCLAFDFTKSPYYKVVCVCALSSRSKDSRFQIEVYSSETGAWRSYEESFTSRVHFEYGVYWNGAIHWIWSTRDDQEYQPIYFNPDMDRTPKVMPALPTLDGDYKTRNCYFGESCDHIHYIDVYKTLTQFSVYEMKKDYSEWFAKYKVDLSNIGGNLFSILAVIRGCDLNDDDNPFLVLKLRGNVIRYDINGGKCETIAWFMGDTDRYTISKCPAAKTPLQLIDCLCQV